MGRKQTNPAHQYFVYDLNTKKSECKLCKKHIEGMHGMNLERHIERNHREEYQKLKRDQETNQAHITISKEMQQKPKIQTQLQIDSMNKIKIAMNKETLINSCVELVTVNGRPFSILEDSGFRSIINPILLGLREKTSINSENIKKYIDEEAQKIRSQIKSDIENKLICLKIDAATRLDRSFLGINVQYFNKGKIVLKTLALKELNESHTGEYLKQIIINVCKNYGIEEYQIYTITTDNGANMLKTIKLISQSNDATSESDDDDDSVQNTTEKSVENEITLTNHLENICHGIRCAAHTLQLAIEDAFKENQTATKVIAKARNVVKKLRTQTFLNFIKKSKCKKPILDCTTRWHSTLDMLLRLQELREFCTDIGKGNPEIVLSDADYTKIDDICKSLLPAKMTTKKLQTEQLTLGDFYGCWIELKLQIEKINNNFSSILYNKIVAREKLLLNNEIMTAAIFLDPRYKILLNADDENQAKEHLKNIWVQINQIDNLDSNTAQNTSTVTQTQNKADSSLSDASGSESSDDVENLLKLKENLTPSNVSKEQMLKNIDNIMSAYSTEQRRLSRKSSILSYWENMKESKPELYKMAKVILSVPATQVSVERLFSGLKFILNPYRTNLKDNTLDDIILIRTNNLVYNKKEQHSNEKPSALQTDDVTEVQTKKLKLI